MTEIREPRDIKFLKTMKITPECHAILTQKKTEFGCKSYEETILKLCGVVRKVEVRHEIVNDKTDTDPVIPPNL